MFRYTLRNILIGSITPAMSTLGKKEPLTSTVLMERARELAASGEMQQAEQAYAEALKLSPRQPEALNFLGMCAVRRGEAVIGTSLVKKASDLQPGNAAILCNLGLCYESAGEWESALGVFRRALEAMPRFYDARLHLAYALEQLGRGHEALTHYFGAIFAAQGEGHWMSESSVPANLRPLIEHAMGYVNEGRRALFDAVLEPLREQHGRNALGRVEHCLAAYLREIPTQYADPRQRPTFLHFPDMPAQPYLSRGLFPWIEEYEASTAAIREELAAVLTADRNLEPVHQGLSAAEQSRLLHSAAGTPMWDAFFFHRHGASYQDNCQRCPRTMEALERLPIARIREHAPEIFFSVLRPDTHILPHRGVSNIRIVTHLPLLVPADCALRVAEETHEWNEGRVVAFDDTYEHEAWNRGNQTRVVLIADVWNPYLTEVERAALAQLVGSIGDFNRACGIG